MSIANKENGINKKYGDKYIITVDVLEKINDQTNIYSGFLHRIEVNNEGDIDLIILTEASLHVTILKQNIHNLKVFKDELSKDNSHKLYVESVDRYTMKKLIQGNFLIVKYCNVVNIN